ncbi:Disease resistance protein RPS2 [Camellia lanceoleosa]|uniref:Disease resistance protein RPS2 n=1 Tax=Camellia lanceoleosa TaxID=1840588 RepID=A0ACC0GVA3_9ERIC|nr:Disease resistance protein RPS2 [Camellia lanceoleosa]
MAEELNREESLQLFNWHAFGDINPLENYADLANGIVSYASGLPLALEVLSSYLFGRNMVEWKSALDKLQQIPHEKIQEKLGISFDALDDDNIKDSFLDIAWQPALAEWDAKEIYLNNNHLFELPEKPNCPSLVALFLQENYDLMEIPSSLFECMPMLQVLDLSHTSIKSLPASISGLVSLQELFLRGCELLMELPPEIGALSKIQVLDLEGTELMYLSKEISELRKLECLKVSLYGCGKRYREGKQICKRIPAGLLASLYLLKALSIDVNPDDDEWVADVKDVMDELLKLKRLMTLKLYLPKVGLLKEITSVRNFKFTVGHHKRCIISCLPHEVEEEFKKQENYLKYINGKYIPIEIQNALKCTCAFFLERHWAVKKLSEFGNENMVELKFCLLVECNELQTIIDGVEFRCRRSTCESVDKTPVFQSLEYLGIHCMMNLRSIWEGPIGKGCLSKLKYMALHSCPNLTSIFTTSLLGDLDNLEELIIEDCLQINSLVSQESLCFEPNPFLPSLKKISLLDLTELVSISSGHLFAPKLERIIIYACPMLESLSPMELSSNYLKVIKGEIEWWNSLKWLESEWSSRQKYYMANVFVELKRDARLMDQLAKSRK